MLDEIELDLDVGVGIETVHKLKDDLCAAYDKSETIIVNTEGYEKADTAVLQLLLAFYVKAKLEGKTVRFGKLSERFIESINRLGMSTQLGLA